MHEIPGVQFVRDCWQVSAYLALELELTVIKAHELI